MSTFSGIIQEIQNVNVDRFDAHNFDAEIYFLSHCHSDHMVGLNTEAFQNMLIEQSKFIYASEISCAILKKMYPQIRNNVKVLDITRVNVLNVSNKFLSVSLIAAGHCPGSVMFLFEFDKVRVLYTGDFRVNPKDFVKFRTFYDSYGTLKVIDKLYLDTTFYSKQYPHFPGRDASLKEACRLIRDWITQSAEHVIKLITCARYGYEYLFKKLYQEFQTPIYIDNDEVFQFYKLVPELDETVTNVRGQSQIYNTYNWKKTVDDDDKQYKVIKFSALSWKNFNPDEPVSSSTNNAICFSTHASFAECNALIDFLKPKAIEANVISVDPKIAREINERVDSYNREVSYETELKFEEVKLFPVVEANCSKKIKLDEELVDDETDFLLDSPPRIRKLNKKEECEDNGCLFLDSPPRRFN